ncbi:MAG TPA: class I SAM-dependent methyltransferase [Pyrinomonadaceae bacterium]|nr:class I SAM-dependent methyltransferase [Pyrinomonadaceae bacterium]
MPGSNITETLVASHYAFIDLGSGNGGSIDHCVRRFGRGPGLGFELDPTKAAEARDAGFDVVEADVRLVVVPERSVEYISAMDFLEHLPDAASASAVLEKFGRVARSFIFIRYPSFEETEYLRSLGLKLCWSDWTEHPNMMLIEDLVGLFERLGWTDYAIIPRNLITDSRDDQLVPLSAPTDTLLYDPSTLEPKPIVRLDRPVFAQYDIFVRLGDELNDADWDRLLGSDIAATAPTWAAKTISAGSVAPAVAGEFGFYDSKTSEWSIRRQDGTEELITYGGANQGLLPLIGNFSGRGNGLGLYQPATANFFLRHAMSAGPADIIVGFGPEGGIPLAGDWTGSGSDKIGIYVPRTGQWFLRHTNSGGEADESFSFGPPNAAWLPVVGDWDGDGRDSVGLYDPETGSWHLRGESSDRTSERSFTCSPARGLPVAGDWDGDGRDSIGIYVPDWGMWILRNSNSNCPADAAFIYRGEGLPIALRSASR